MLTAVSCTNFRALQSVSITLEPLTALVGPNGSGKSAVLRAIDLMLGERWPNLACLRVPQDFTDFQHERELRVQVSFDPPLLSDPDAADERAQVHHLRLTCRPYKRTGKWGIVGDPNLDFEALDAVEGKPMQCVRSRANQPREFRPLLGVSTALREQAATTLIDHQRGVAQQRPWTRGSVLLKLLEPAHRELGEPVDNEDGSVTRRDAFRARFEEAMAFLRTPHVVELEAAIEETTKRTLGFLGGSRASDVSVGFGIADPTNPLNSFRLVYREGGIEIPAEEAGLGVQSAIVIGLFEALRRTQRPAGTVLIDEPEMYLHPQAQRYFHKLLVEMTERGQAQVIYSTHSPIFAEAHRFETLRLLRRAPAGYSSVTAADLPMRAKLERDRGKLLANYDASRSEALFADAVLLVEGAGDQLAAREIAKSVPVDLDAENLSVISCGGKTAIPYHARLCQALDIPVCVMYDDDLRPEPDENDQSEAAAKTRRQNHQAREESREIDKVVLSPADRFVCSPNLETMLGIGEGKDKPGRVLQRVRERPDEVPDALRDAVWRLADLVGCAPAPF